MRESQHQAIATTLNHLASAGDDQIASPSQKVTDALDGQGLSISYKANGLDHVDESDRGRFLPQ